jgi:two-component system, NtrC family, nitrogen regulation response regulator NtrX
VAEILVVDDDANNRLLVQTVAQHHGHAVHHAATGEDALEFCAGKRVDLIILDLGLPGMGGTELLQRLRRDTTTRNVPVALYTGSEPNAAMRDFMEMYGVAFFIQKPTEPDDLLRAISSAIG